MTTAGLCETSGDWLYDLGLPGRRGISGGIVTVSPGRGAVGTFAPPLDTADNNVKGRLGVNLKHSRSVATVDASQVRCALTECGNHVDLLYRERGYSRDPSFAVRRNGSQRIWQISAARRIFAGWSFVLELSACQRRSGPPTEAAQ
jgi:hypothetical protein